MNRPESPLLVALLAASVVGCALALVTSQYRSRELFAELEVAQQETKTLESDGARLRSDLGRAAQPAAIEAVARRLGMRAINPNEVVVLPVPAPAVPRVNADADTGTHASAREQR